MKNIDLSKVHLAPIYFIEIPLKPHLHQIQVLHRQDRREQLLIKQKLMKKLSITLWVLMKFLIGNNLVVYLNFYSLINSRSLNEIIPAPLKIGFDILF